MSLSHASKETQVWDRLTEKLLLQPPLSCSCVPCLGSHRPCSSFCGSLAPALWIKEWASTKGFLRSAYASICNQDTDITIYFQPSPSSCEIKKKNAHVNLIYKSDCFDCLSACWVKMIFFKWAEKSPAKPCCQQFSFPPYSPFSRHFPLPPVLVKDSVCSEE